MKINYTLSPLFMHVPGGYVSVKLSFDSKQIIERWGSNCGIYSIIDDLHATLMYDRSNPEIDSTEYYKTMQKAYSAKIVDLKEMGTKGDKWFAIALVLDSPELSKRHEDLTSLGFKHSYEEYVPHLSLMYTPSDEDLGKIQEHFWKLKGIDLIFENETLEPIRE